MSILYIVLMQKINLDQLHHLICYAIDEAQFVILTDRHSCGFM